MKAPPAARTPAPAGPGAGIPPGGGRLRARAAIPCSVTALRLAATPVVTLLMVTGAHGLGLLVAAGVGAADLLDGFLARRLGAATTFGAWLDSVADRTLGLAVVAGVIGAGVVASPLVVLLAVVLAIQTALALPFLRSAHRDARRPKTLMGTVVGALLLTLLLPLSSAAHLALELSTAVAAIDGTWWYWRQSRSGRRGGAYAEPPVRTASVRDELRRLRGPAPEAGDRVMTVANAITLSRIGPAVVGIHLLADGQIPLAIVCGLAFAALDIADGVIARACGQCSGLGWWLERLVDKPTLVAVVLVVAHEGWIDGWVATGYLLRLTIIGGCVVVLRRAHIRPPRSFCSALANVSLAVAVVVPAATGVAVVLNAHNVVHFIYWTGQSLLRRIEARRVRS